MKTYEFKDLLDPESVAVVGSTSRNRFYFLRSLVSAGFKGAIYPVNPNVKAAFGHKFYPSLLDVPDKVDLVISEVPARVTPRIIEECVKKEAKGVVVFASGFSEAGTEEGVRLEKEIVRIAGDGGVRIIGPNCLGIYHPEHGLAFRPDLPRDPGPVGFVSQSGGHAINFALIGKVTGLRFSTVVSFGNGCDVDAAEVLDYLTDDPKTKVISVYVEGVRDGRRFFSSLKRAAARKPVVVWKGGRTEVGSRAVASHTGSLAGSPKVWESVIQQCNAVPVKSFYEMVDTVLAFMFCPRVEGRRVGLVSISGGSGVVNSDYCSEVGLEVPQLSENAREKMSRAIQNVGTSVANPIDLAGSFMSPIAVKTVFETLKEEDNIDSVIFELAVQYPSFYADFIDDPSLSVKFYNMLVEECREAGKVKPVLVAIPQVAYEEAQRYVRDVFVQAKLPVFPSVERAANALKNIINYYTKNTTNQSLHTATSSLTAEKSKEAKTRY
ncbi:MAG: CoA-binding protein [Candidatus Jordarchaeales archaeon]